MLAGLPSVRSPLVVIAMMLAFHSGPPGADQAKPASATTAAMPTLGYHGIVSVRRPRNAFPGEPHARRHLPRSGLVQSAPPCMTR